MLQADDIRRRLQDASTQQAALAEVADWVVDTCLIAGVSTITAYRVALVFVEGLAGVRSYRLKTKDDRE